MSDENGIVNDQSDPADDNELSDDEIGAIAGGANPPGYVGYDPGGGYDQPA